MLIVAICESLFTLYLTTHAQPSLDAEGDAHERAHKPEEKQCSEQDVERALNQLKKYYGLWKPIGIELGIDVGVINDIGRDQKGDSNCLQALIKQLPNSDNPTLTCKRLLKVLQSERVKSAVGGMQEFAKY